VISENNHHLIEDPERILAFDFIRATESAALNAWPWLGRGDKNSADQAACDAIRGVLDGTNCRGTVIIGEGIKDEAPGIFVGEKIGSWARGGRAFDIAVDPIDGTSNFANGLPNSLSVIAATATDGGTHQMRHLPSFYAEKLAWGPRITQAMQRDMPALSLALPIEDVLARVACGMLRPVRELSVCVLKRPRNEELIERIRACGASLRLITDGDITAALAPSMPSSGVDLYAGIGGSTEAVLTAAALKTLGGGMLVRMWPRDATERERLLRTCGITELRRSFTVDDLVKGANALFCATGISDSPLLPGICVEHGKLVTTSILMRSNSRTVRHIRAVHDLQHKQLRLRHGHNGSAHTAFSSIPALVGDHAESTPIL
jgi:fructose-1,6-bisphosphatase II